MRFHGRVGYADTVETKPGLWVEKIIFREYYGDVIRNNSRNSQGDKINSDILITNQVSIVADPYALGHFYNIKCIEFQGVLWQVSDIDASQPPRLILSLGGLYHEDLESTT